MTDGLYEFGHSAGKAEFARHLFKRIEPIIRRPVEQGAEACALDIISRYNAIVEAMCDEIQIAMFVTMSGQGQA